jgi:hypothetical protein
MPIYSARWVEAKERILTANSSAEAVADIARVFRAVDGFEVECIELREVVADQGRDSEVGVIEIFEFRPGPAGGSVHCIAPAAPDPVDPDPYAGLPLVARSFMKLFPSLAGAVRQ